MSIPAVSIEGQRCDRRPWLRVAALHSHTFLSPSALAGPCPPQLRANLAGRVTLSGLALHLTLGALPPDPEKAEPEPRPKPTGQSARLHPYSTSRAARAGKRQKNTPGRRWEGEPRFWHQETSQREAAVWAQRTGPVTPAPGQGGRRRARPLPWARQRGRKTGWPGSDHQGAGSPTVRTRAELCCWRQERDVTCSLQDRGRSTDAKQPARRARSPEDPRTSKQETWKREANTHPRGSRARSAPGQHGPPRGRRGEAEQVTDTQNRSH